MNGRQAGRALTALLTVATVGLCAACTPLATPTVPADPGGSAAPAVTPPVAEPGGVKLALGDCLDRIALSDNNPETAPVVDCSAEHELEIFAQFDIDSARYPSTVEFDELASPRCVVEFATFVGVDFGISTLDFEYYYPTEEAWLSGDRRVDCAVFDPDGSVTGTLREAAR